MNKMVKYRQYIRQVLQAYADLPTSHDDVKREVLFDTEHDRYQVLIVGWRGHRRFHSSIVHVDLIKGRIWLQYDMTERGVANDFLGLGVPKEDIILAFHAPYKRKFTGFGLGGDDIEEV